MRKFSIAASLALALFASTHATSARSANVATATAPRPQQSSAAPASGTAAPASSAAKKKKTSKKHRSAKREPTQKAPTPERISEIQSALARGGYYQGTPSGKWDSNTVAAMQQFQSENGLSSSGKIDAPSLQKLGLGSSTAGVDAPKPLPLAGSSPNSSGATPAATNGATATPANSTTANATTASSATPASSAAPTHGKPQH